MPEQQIPPIWYSGDPYPTIYYNDGLIVGSSADPPADARRLYPAVIDEAALARAADEMHDRFCLCGDRVGTESHDGIGERLDYLYHAQLYVEAYLRALGGERGE